MPYAQPLLRLSMLFFGIGMVALWIFALATGAREWFAWVMAIAGALGLYAAILMKQILPSAARASGLAFSLGTLAVLIAALGTGRATWLLWAAVALTAGLLLASLASPEPRHRMADDRVPA